MQAYEIRKFKNPELHGSLKKLAAEERKLTHEAVLHIIEVMRRRLYLEMKCQSLFEYLVVEIGYCNASAQLRIDAANLMIEVPEVGIKIEEGSLNLSQVGKIQKTYRAAKKLKDIRISREEKKDFINQVENKSAKETEVLLAQVLDLPLVQKETVKIQKDESVRYQLTLSKEEFELINQARSYLSHALEKAQDDGSSKMKNLLLYWAKKEIAQRTSSVKVKEKREEKKAEDRKEKQEGKKPEPTCEVKKESRFTSSSEVKEEQQFTSSDEVEKSGSLGEVDIKTKATSLYEVKIPDNSKPLSPSLRKEILNRDQGCQFRHHPQDQPCGSEHFLEVDHIQPRWADGNNAPENLRAVCRNHNQYRYEFGR